MNPTITETSDAIVTSATARMHEPTITVEEIHAFTEQPAEPTLAELLVDYVSEYEACQQLEREKEWLRTKMEKNANKKASLGLEIRKRMKPLTAQTIGNWVVIHTAAGISLYPIVKA